jgi:hypothetical protein
MRSGNASFFAFLKVFLRVPRASVLLILKFVAPRAEFSDLLGGPGFSPSEAKFLSVGFSR